MYTTGGLPGGPGGGQIAHPTRNKKWDISGGSPCGGDKKKKSGLLPAFLDLDCLEETFELALKGVAAQRE